MLSLGEEARDHLGIILEAVFIVHDLGAMGHIVSYLLRKETHSAAKIGNTLTKPKPPTKPVALN